MFARMKVIGTKNRCALFCIVLASCFGCGSSDSSGSGGANDPMDARLFVPEGIDFESLNTASVRLKLEASTLREVGKGAEYLVSIRNTGTELTCGVHFVALFTTVTGDTLGTPDQTLATADVPVHGKLYQDSHEEGCLAAGEVGFGHAPLFPELTSSTSALTGITQKTTKILYQFQGGLPRTAAPLDVSLENVDIASQASAKALVRGQFHNGSALEIARATVDVFSLNAVGRPIVVGSVQNSAVLSPGIDWSFEAPIAGPVGEYVAFPWFPLE
jgi:hypothetical protein